MKYTTHNNIAILLYWLAFFILTPCLPVAIISGKLICFASLIIIPVIYFFLNYVTAKCNRKKCKGSSLKRNTSNLLRSLMSEGAYKITYTCNNCGKINHVDGAFENTYD